MLYKPAELKYNKAMKGKINFIFDLYNTLIEVRTDNHKKEAWDVIALAIEEAGGSGNLDALEGMFNLLCEKKLNHAKSDLVACGSRVQYPDLDYREVLSDLFISYGASPEEVDFDEVLRGYRAATIERICPYNAVEGLFKAIKERGGRIYLLSNAQLPIAPEEAKECNILQYFDGACYSSQAKIAKPDIEFYDLLFKRFDLDKSESVMVGDDVVKDIKAAKKYGVDAIRCKQGVDKKIAAKILKLLDKYNISRGL